MAVKSCLSCAQEIALLLFYSFKCGVVNIIFSLGNCETKRSLKSRVVKFDFFAEPVFDLSKPVRNQLFELVVAKPCMQTGRHRSSEVVCLFERLICGRDCSEFWLWSGLHSWLCHMWPLSCGKYRKLPKSASRNCIWHLAIAVRACLDHLTKWSMILTSSTADRDHWSRSAALPSAAQYAKLPEWATVLAVWHQCGRTVGYGRVGEGGASCTLITLTK